MRELHRTSIFASNELTYTVSVSTHKGDLHVNLHHPAIGRAFWEVVTGKYTEYDERNVITIRTAQTKSGVEHWPQMSDFATPNFDAGYNPNHHLEMIRLYPLRDIVLNASPRPSSLSFYGTIELVMHDGFTENSARYAASITRRVNLDLRTGFIEIEP